MDYEELKNRTNEMAETVNCWESLEDEVLKLFCLFSKCSTFKHESQELVNINYVREKIFNLLVKNPTILSEGAKKLFYSMKIERENASN